MTALPAPLPLTLTDDDPPEAVRATPAPSSTRTAAPGAAPASTYSAYETLPDGRERRLVAGLRYTMMLGHRFDGQTWAVAWRID